MSGALTLVGGGSALFLPFSVSPVDADGIPCGITQQADGIRIPIGYSIVLWIQAIFPENLFFSFIWD